MQENTGAIVPMKKKRIRRRMVNGVLVYKNGSSLNTVTDCDNSIQDVGEDCQCKRYRCFEPDVTTTEERKRTFTWFRKLSSFQMQELYLSDLITVEGIKARRNKVIENRAEAAGKKSEHSASFFYKLKIPDPDERGYRELNVCRMAFLNILGISRNRLRATQQSLYNQQKRVPVDMGNQKPTEDMFVPEPLEGIIISQIDEYALSDVLSETYSVFAMHKHFLNHFRINVPYNVYWVVFHSKWNIAQFKPNYTCCPTFDTFYETLNMFGLVDFSILD